MGQRSRRDADDAATGPMDRTAIRSFTDKSGQVWIHKDDLLGFLCIGTTSSRPDPNFESFMRRLINGLDRVAPPYRGWAQRR